MVQIYVINGSNGVGKDTFVELIRDYLINHNKKLLVRSVSSVAIVKEAAKILGWDGTKDEKSRKFLSDLKLLSTEAYDAPFKYMKSCVDKSYNDVALFFHIREPEEINKFVTHYPQAKTILVRRNVEVADNMADIYVEDYKYDYYINNYGTFDTFRSIAKEFTIDVLLKA